MRAKRSKVGRIESSRRVIQSLDLQSLFWGQVAGCKDLLEHGGLACDVGVDVHTWLCGERHLHSAVFIPQIGPRPEHITNGEMVSHIERASAADIHVATRFIIGSLECLTAADAEVAPVQVADRRQRGHGSRHTFAIDYNIDVEDGLRSEARNGR